jgi:hypothetical protein
MVSSSRATTGVAANNGSASATGGGRSNRPAPLNYQLSYAQRRRASIEKQQQLEQQETARLPIYQRGPLVRRWLARKARAEAKEKEKQRLRALSTGSGASGSTSAIEALTNESDRDGDGDGEEDGDLSRNDDQDDQDITVGSNRLSLDQSPVNPNGYGSSTGCCFIS